MTGDLRRGALWAWALALAQAAGVTASVTHEEGVPPREALTVDGAGGPGGSLKRRGISDEWA